MKNIYLNGIIEGAAPNGADKSDMAFFYKVLAPMEPAH